MLATWFMNHKTNPYPTIQEKRELVEKTSLSMRQVNNWFTNMRKRHWKPLKQGRKPRSYEEYKLLEEMKKG